MEILFLQVRILPLISPQCRPAENQIARDTVLGIEVGDSRQTGCGFCDSSHFVWCGTKKSDGSMNAVVDEISVTEMTLLTNLSRAKKHRRVETYLESPAAED